MASQIEDTVLAIPAFVPLTVCTGYVAAWFTDLHGFRQRSLVERLFWSIPLSISLSTISLVLIGRFVSLGAASALLALCTILFLVVLAWEWLQLRRSGRKCAIGWQPLGTCAFLLAILSAAIVVLSLVDLQSKERLYMSLTFYDHGSRVNWAESALRTGVPPDNSLYLSNHAAPMRYYYFWPVDCAVVAKISGLPVRAVMFASCVWAIFSLVALSGLFFKHFLSAGTRLRRQFLLLFGLLTVTGLYALANIWAVFIAHMLLPGYIEVWNQGQITSWIDNFLFYPHHVAGMVCCMFAFLLAWMAARQPDRGRIVTVIFVGFAFATAFGISIYVAFAFFIIMLAWGIWQLGFERILKPSLLLAAGGVVAALLLCPYLRELTHGASKEAGPGVFRFAIRETAPPEGLLKTPLFHGLATTHPQGARNLANLVLMAPSYAIELGFYFVVLLVFLIPALRGRMSLTPAEKSLVFIALAAFPLMSFMRSNVLDVNDFGIHCGLFVQYPLLLLASELLVSWQLERTKASAATLNSGLFQTPRWLQSISRFAIFIGVLSTIYIALILRFYHTLLPEQPNHSLYHKAYISYLGYSKLDSAIPRDAVVQFNPSGRNPFWRNTDLINVNRQVVIAGDQLWCGSELGGDPMACPAMAADIGKIFRDGNPQLARRVCQKYGIQYLVANMYDPTWKDQQSWVWTLKPVVADPEFRALDCR